MFTLCVPISESCQNHLMFFLILLFFYFLSMLSNIQKLSANASKTKPKKKASKAKSTKIKTAQANKNSPKTNNKTKTKSTKTNTIKTKTNKTKIQSSRAKSKPVNNTATTNNSVPSTKQRQKATEKVIVKPHNTTLVGPGSILLCSTCCYPYMLLSIYCLFCHMIQLVLWNVYSLCAVDLLWMTVWSTYTHYFTQTTFAKFIELLKILQEMQCNQLEKLFALVCMFSWLICQFIS